MKLYILEKTIPPSQATWQEIYFCINLIGKVTRVSLAREIPSPNET